MEVLDQRILKQRIVIRRIIQLFILIAVFLMAIVSISHENDIFWQLKMGEEIVVNHHFPISDPYNFSNPGAVWTLEEWLPSVLFYIIYIHVGSAGLIILKAIIVTLTFSLFLVLFNKKKVNLYLSFLIMSLTIMINTRGSWGVFPSIFEYLFIVTTLLLLEYYREKKKRIVPIILVPFSFLWAQTHASFFLLTAILGAYIGGNFAAQFLKTKWAGYQPLGESVSNQKLKPLIAAFAATVITPFFTPNGYFLWLYPFRISFSKFTSYVSEYQKFWEVWNWNWNDYVHGFTFILIVVMIIIFIVSIKHLHPIDFILGFLFMVLALTAVRHVAIFALVALFVTSRYIGFWFGEYRGFFKRRLIIDILLILFIVCFVFNYKTNIAPFGFGLIESDYPKEAAEFINTNKIPGNMFNHYNYGGYLIWKMPNYKVFIDGRLEMYLGQAGEDYKTILEGGDGYKELLDKYHINFFLIYHSDPVISRLLGDPDWRFIHHSDQYAVFVRNSKQNSFVISKYWTPQKQNEFNIAYNNYLADEANKAGMREMDKGNARMAAEYFAQATIYDPNLTIAKFNLARAYFAMGWWNESKDEFQLVLKEDPKNKDAERGLKEATRMKQLSEKGLLIKK